MKIINEITRYYYLFFRRSDFEKVLNGYNSDIETFRKKETMTLDEMRNNMEKLNDLDQNLNKALLEFEVCVLKSFPNFGQYTTTFDLLCKLYY